MLECRHLNHSLHRQTSVRWSWSRGGRNPMNSGEPNGANTRVAQNTGTFDLNFKQRWSKAANFYWLEIVFCLQACPKDWCLWLRDLQHPETDASSRAQLISCTNDDQFNTIYSHFTRFPIQNLGFSLKPFVISPAERRDCLRSFICSFRSLSCRISFLPWNILRKVHLTGTLVCFT